MWVAQQILLWNTPLATNWLKNNLVSYYKADTSWSFNDSHWTNNWTLYWATYTASWKINWAYNFVGVFEQYLTLPNGVIPWGTNTLSIWFWAKYSSTSWNMAIIMTARTGEWLLIYQSGPYLVFSKPNVSDLLYNMSADTSWHYYICSSDWSWMEIKKDNNVVATNTNTSNWVNPNWDPISIWNYLNNGSMASGWGLDWTLDELWIWNNKVSVDKWTLLYNSGNWLSYDTFTN